MLVTIVKIITKSDKIVETKAIMKSLVSITR